MKIAAVTVTNQPNNPGLLQLKRSAERHGYDLHIIEKEWRGFGGKILDTAEFCRQHQDQYTHVLFMDAHDTYFVRPESELIEKLWNKNIMLLSAEKACWPDPGRAPAYGYVNGPFSPWCYVNSGQYLAPIDLFLRIVEENPIAPREDDQRWMTNVYLRANMDYSMFLDVSCMFFQSIAFEAANEFKITPEQGLYNLITDTYPFAIHGNGKTDMKHIYKL